MNDVVRIREMSAAHACVRTYVKDLQHYRQPKAHCPWTLHEIISPIFLVVFKKGRVDSCLFIYTLQFNQHHKCLDRWFSGDCIAIE